MEQLLTIPPAIVYRPTKSGGWRQLLIPATRIGLALDPPNLGDEEEERRPQRGA